MNATKKFYEFTDAQLMIALASQCRHLARHWGDEKETEIFKTAVGIVEESPFMIPATYADILLHYVDGKAEKYLLDLIESAAETGDHERARGLADDLQAMRAMQPSEWLEMMADRVVEIAVIVAPSKEALLAEIDRMEEIFNEIITTNQGENK